MPVSKISPEQRQAIASDHRPVKDIVAEYGIKQAQVYRIKAAAIPTPDSYSVGDATAFLNRLRRHKIPVGVVATSPPYNFGYRRRHDDGNWKASVLWQQGYSAHNDNLPRARYVAGQQAMLTAALELVGDDGVVCYQHKPMHRNLTVNMQTDILDGFPVRQIVIWNRGSSNNHEAAFAPPSYEFVAFIAGRRWKWQGQGFEESRQWGAVWNIPPATGNPHEAPFPLELARRMILAGNGGAVADPYAGSGTIGYAAQELGIPFYLNDISRRYAYDFLERTTTEGCN